MAHGLLLSRLLRLTQTATIHMAIGNWDWRSDRLIPKTGATASFPAILRAKFGGELHLGSQDSRKGRSGLHQQLDVGAVRAT